jgi:phosphotriesterase-related protein
MTIRDDRSPGLNRREALKLLGLGGGAITTLRGDTTLAAQAAQSAPNVTFPRGTVIRTVLKDVPPASIGVGHALIHEHLNVRDLGEKKLLDADGRSDATIIDELRAAAKEGLRCIVDAAVARRNDEQIARLKQIATQSGVHIVMGGGYYLAPNYPADILQMPENQLADHLSQDAKNQGLGAFGEIGSSMEMHPEERKMHRAVAKAHLRTGLPVFTHTPHEGCAKCALDQMDIHESLGVNPQKLCIGHVGDILDDPKAETHKSIAKRGAFVGFDTVGHFIPSAPTSGDFMKVRMILALLDAGHEDHILLSSDFAHQDCLQRYWGAGYSTVTGVFVPKLRNAGVKEVTIQKILVDNSRRFLAFTPMAT